MAEDATKTNIPQFLVVNGAELLERFAYYGIVAINALYLQSLGYSFKDIGFLSALLLALPYVVPVLTGFVAERVGYKPVMLAGFVLYGSGFLVLSSTTQFGFLAGGAILLAIGAGMFKPLTAASIAHLTSLDHRTMGYNLYYMGINVGGFLGPILVAKLEGNYQLAFLLGALIMAADFVLIFLLFRNPVAPQKAKNLRDAFAPFVQVLFDVPFQVLLLIFSGFWFLYVMNFTFLTLYTDSFLTLPTWFKPEMQQAIDPLFVILLGIPLGKLAQKSDPVRMMALGITLLVTGFLLIGFVSTFEALVAGIIIGTAGEVLAYPGFLNYVSRIAPKDRVAVYQGFGFLPLFVGFFFGPIVGGWLYEWLAKDLGRPVLFWVAMCIVPVIAIAAFLVYARLGTPREERTHRSAVFPIAVLLLIPLLFLGATAAGTREAHPPLTETPLATAAMTFLNVKTGDLNEGQSTSLTVALPRAVANVTFRLTWFDPVSTTPGTANQPDTFRLAIQDQAGHEIAKNEAANSGGTAGTIVLVVPAAQLPGNATVQVTLVSAGDTTTTLGGQTVTPDTSNGWTLRVTGRATVPAASPSATS